MTLQALSAFSARLGGDPLLIQGPGGNTSLKAPSPEGRNLLHVKASGLWLRDAATRPCFVALDLAALRDRLRNAEGDPPLGDLVVPGEAGQGMRPSIETSLHAVLPHRVVVHTHSVNALAILVRADARAVLAPLLHGLRWSFVPYARPGRPLLRAVEAAGGAEADVLMLENHGLVLGAANVDAAARLHAELERRLARPLRPAPLAPDLAALDALGASHGWRPARHAESHALATDPASRDLAAKGAFYPDHVVFLGPGPIRTVDAASVPGRCTGKLLPVAGLGTLVPRTISEGEEEMVRCLALVLSRCDPHAPFRTLSAADEAELTGWDAEAHRRALDAAGRA